MYVAIVGSAGRRDYHLWSRNLYLRCVPFIDKYLTSRDIGTDVHLVSGGAAWADHFAVSLFLKGRASNLTIFSPTDWMTKPEAAHHGPTPGYLDWGTKDPVRNPGSTANYYHKRFSEKMEPGNPTKSLCGIQKAHEKGALIDQLSVLSRGSPFLARNMKVARYADLLLAFTFSSTGEPADGGTAHTWKHTDCEKIHFDLGRL